MASGLSVSWISFVNTYQYGHYENQNALEKGSCSSLNQVLLRFCPTPPLGIASVCEEVLLGQFLAIPLPTSLRAVVVKRSIFISCRIFSLLLPSISGLGRSECGPSKRKLELAGAGSASFVCS